MTTRANGYRVTAPDGTYITADLWNGSVGDLHDRMLAQEAKVASFEALEQQGIQASLDYIQATVAPELETLSNGIAAAQDQIDQIIIDGQSPDSQKLGGQLPSYYAPLQAMLDGLASKVPLTRTVNGKALSADVMLMPSDIGLGQVNNTRDADKPVSAPQLAALDRKASLAALADRNIVINGNFNVSQEHGDTAVEPGDHPADQWYGASNLASARYSRTVANSFGMSRVMQIYHTTGLLSYAANAYTQLTQHIEGYRIHEALAYGYVAHQRASTVAFRVKTNRPGTYTFHVRSSNSDASFLAPFTITEADTWELKIIHVPPPPEGLGTWIGHSVARGATIGFCTDVGTDLSGVEGWQAGERLGITGQTNLSGSGAGAQFFIGSVRWFVGTLNPSSADVQETLLDYTEDLRRCQRYYQTFAYRARWTPHTTNDADGRCLPLPTPMRTGPSISAVNIVESSSVASYQLITRGIHSFEVSINPSATSGTAWRADLVFNARL